MHSVGLLSEWEQRMDSSPDSGSLSMKSELLCEFFIEALRELRSETNATLTVSSLSRCMMKKEPYLAALGSGAGRSGPPEESIDLQSFVRRLQGFQVCILKVFHNAFNQFAENRAEELCALAEQKSRLAETIELNSRILDFITDVSCKASFQCKELLDLLAEVTVSLVEVENILSVSYSNAAKIYGDNKVFANTVEMNVQDISNILQTSQNMDEIKNLISSKLENIKAASKGKQEADNQNRIQMASEIDNLKSQLKMMRKQIFKVQKKADKMEKSSLMDHLTGVANRRAYQKYVREEWDEFRRTGSAFSILMIDIDNFKSINDRFGHWAGDKCVVKLAKRLKVNLRGTDFLARYGGDEFVAVLPRTEQKGASKVAENLRGNIENTRFLYEGERIPLTISIGGSTVKKSDKNIIEILERADKALFDTKEHGRNWISMA